MVLSYQMMLRRLSHPALGGLVLGLALAGCATPPPPVPVPAAPPPSQGRYTLGQPYQIDGTWYYPAADFSYDETGIASVYGAESDRKPTANGELFDQNVASAGHKTLALPTIVQVTNLENGRSIELRVNDRGPVVDNRIIQVSRRAAQLLGIDEGAAARVRVRVEVPETIQAQSIARNNGGDTAAEEAPPAVPYGNVVALTLPPPGSNLAPQPVPTAPAAQPDSLPPPPTPVALPETVTLMPVQPSHIFIQAGSYAKSANALRMQALIGGLGTVEVTGTKVNGFNVFRVRLGPIASVEEADRLLTRVVGAGAGDAKIVID
jgi:rare lipoprotein A